MVRSIWLCLLLMLGTQWIALDAAWGRSDGDAAIELSGFSASEAFDLNAGDRLDFSDSQFLKLLYRSGKVSTVNFNKWAQFADDVSWMQLIETPHRFRFWTFQRTLVLTRLVQVRLPRDRDAGEVKGVYLAYCESDSGQPVLLITRSAPRKIALDQPLREPISMVGFFYNNVAVDARGGLLPSVVAAADDVGQGDSGDTDAGADVDAVDRGGAGQGGGDEFDGRVGDVPGGDDGLRGNADRSVPLFIANRFAWYPVESTATMAVSRGQLELSARGVDVGLFDYVRRQNSKPLSQFDADAFYQMLAAVTKRNEFAAQHVPAGRPEIADGIGFSELMASPSRHFGEGVSMSGRLRQCVPIEITSGDRQLQVGTTRYYQASLFPDLGGRDVVVRTADDQSIKFEQFPVTLCLPELPGGMTPEALEGRAVDVRGYFYRFIKYQSKVSADANLSGQVSPLVMVSDINVATPLTSAKGVDLLMRTLLLLILGGVVTAIAWGVLKDRIRSGEASTETFDALPEKIDISRFEEP